MSLWDKVLPLLKMVVHLPSQVFQVDFTMPTTGGMEIRGLQILHKYDPDIIEPVYYENKVDDENNYLFEPLAIEDMLHPLEEDLKILGTKSAIVFSLGMGINLCYVCNLILDHNNSEKRIGLFFIGLRMMLNQEVK